MVTAKDLGSVLQMYRCAICGSVDAGALRLSERDGFEVWARCGCTSTRFEIDGRVATTHRLGILLHEITLSMRKRGWVLRKAVR